MLAIFFFLQSELFDPHKVLEFAEYLHESNDYAAALQEYSRYRFLSDSIEIDLAPKMIDCLIRLKHYDEALINARESRNPGYWQGIVYYHAANYDSARHYLMNSHPEDESMASRFIGLSYAREFNFKKMKEHIEFPKDFPALKKPWLGGLLSTIPGAGHAYANRVGDGVFSFLTVAMFGIISYYYYHTDEDLKFGITISATALFYAGNVYGGINAVRNYNYYKNMKYLNEVSAVNNEFEY